MSATITVYTFENEQGHPDSYTTRDPVEAKMRAERYRLRVYASEYEYTDSEEVWDFTEEELPQEGEDKTGGSAC